MVLSRRRFVKPVPPRRAPIPGQSHPGSHDDSVSALLAPPLHLPTTIQPPPQTNVIVVGLDNSGKTTVLNALRGTGGPTGATGDTVPTVGFQQESFKREGLTLTAFDMSGAGKYRVLWESYYRDAHAVIFVVDAADTLRLAVVRDELAGLLAHPDLGPGCPVLFLANKTDLPSAKGATEMARALELEGVRGRPWQIQPCCALRSEGTAEGFAWLADSVRKVRLGERA
jgi:ADP-ribosylation factor-like protein 6